MATIHLVFLHGWSVTNLDTYGQLPVRLRDECARAGMDVTVDSIYLSRYISFHDEVRLPDISRAMQIAVEELRTDVLKDNSRFVCITHSTGGPVARLWWQHYYQGTQNACPMSHLIMLAPANFGSTLAQLGKSKLSRLASMVKGVEPGQGVLDWLELGSMESWELNRKWILQSSPPIDAPNGFYPFVLIGQSIDRKLYDHLNSYTGELGSDGVVRSAAANLNATLITINQKFAAGTDGKPVPTDPEVKYFKSANTPFRIVRGRSHSGPDKGIMASVKTDPAADPVNQDTINAILSCLRVGHADQYNQLITDFATETDKVQTEEKLESPGSLFLTKRYFIHDRFCMVIFRVSDSSGRAVTDYDLIFTAPPDDDPNHLPEGFFADRQQNSLNHETITYFINYDILAGSPPVVDPETGKTVRDKTDGIDSLGLSVTPRPDKGFVRYMPLTLSLDEQFFQQMVRPNCTILIDICLQRLVSNEVFHLEEPIGPGGGMPANGNFKDQEPGDEVLPFESPA